MGEFLPVIDSLLRVKDESRLNELYKIILKREVLSDAELAIAANESAFAKLAELVAPVDEEDNLKLGLRLKIGMLASLIIRRLCCQYPQGQRQAHSVKLVQMVESIVRKSLSAANDHDILEAEYFQYKAAFNAFSESLLVMTKSPPNEENLRIIAPFSDYYLHHLVNWQVPKSWQVLDRLVELYKASVLNEIKACPLKWSNVFAKMLEDEVKIQREPSALDFQLLYRRFQVIALFPECLDDIEIETREALIRRFLCLLDNTRDYDSHRFAVFVFARKILPHLVPRSGPEIDTLIPESYNDKDADDSAEDCEDDDDKQLERINSVSSLLWASLDGLDRESEKMTSSSSAQEVLQPKANQAEKEGPPPKKHCNCYEKMLQPENANLIIKVARRVIGNMQPK